ncbi:2-oxoisovalerate dehydrogenase [candidate division KSB1 bacterium]|nr:MAG: 2-oxoisovalerate dehydrogenase [candidate division KSB1 bacterium]
MNELVFLVEEAAEGGYTARALGAAIFTEADDLASLHEQIRDAVFCHFEDGQVPKIIREELVQQLWGKGK